MSAFDLCFIQFFNIPLRTCHGIPRTDCQYIAFIILSDQVFQYSGIINKRIELIVFDSFEPFLHRLATEPEIMIFLLIILSKLSDLISRMESYSFYFFSKSRLQRICKSQFKVKILLSRLL